MKNFLRENFTALFVLAMFAAGLMAIACGGSGIKELDRNRPLAREEIDVATQSLVRWNKAKNSETKTPKGAIVRSEGRPASAEELAAIDKGLDRLFAKNIAVGYTRNQNTPRTHDRFKFIVRTNDRPDGGGVPVFQLFSGTNYSGTEWEHKCTIPRGETFSCIWAAEEFVAYNDAMIAVPHYDSDFDQLAEVVMYGGEHRTLADEDPVKYNETITHTGGAGHPLY